MTPQEMAMDLANSLELLTYSLRQVDEATTTVGMCSALAFAHSYAREAQNKTAELILLLFHPTNHLLEAHTQ
jgi:hypothetical protein